MKPYIITILKIVHSPKLWHLGDNGIIKTKEAPFSFKLFWAQI